MEAGYLDYVVLVRRQEGHEIALLETWRFRGYARGGKLWRAPYQPMILQVRFGELGLALTADGVPLDSSCEKGRRVAHEDWTTGHWDSLLSYSVAASDVTIAFEGGRLQERVASCLHTVRKRLGPYSFAVAPSSQTPWSLVVEVVGAADSEVLEIPSIIDVPLDNAD